MEAMLKTGKIEISELELAADAALALRRPLPW
jgi:hypothetical protein